MSIPLFEARHLSFAWQDSPSLFSDLNFKIEAGEKVVLLGGNGSGKSTLLKLLNGLIAPKSGEILYQGEPFNKSYWKNAEKSCAFRKACVLLFQHPEAMLFNPTVRDELAYAPRQLKLADVENRVNYWAGQLQLEKLMDKAPFLLSGGQKQKVALACLLTLEPACLLLDEPSASLDPATIGWLIDLFAEQKEAQKKAQKTLLVSTHNLSLAAELGTRALVLAEEKIIFDGKIEAALNNVDLLIEAGLAHKHQHQHKNGDAGKIHNHPHRHDW